MNTEQESATASAVETTTTKAADQLIAHTSNFGLLLLAGDPHGDVTEGASFPQFQYEFCPLNSLYLENCWHALWNRVVAVHGLYGDRIKTWTTDGIGKAPGTSWMTEQIYNPHKEAQVWTYGYDASTSRSGICTKLEIRNKAFRLLDDLLEMRKKWQSVCQGLRHELRLLWVRTKLTCAQHLETYSTRIYCSWPRRYYCQRGKNILETAREAHLVDKVLTSI